MAAALAPAEAALSWQDVVVAFRIAAGIYADCTPDVIQGLALRSVVPDLDLYYGSGF